MGEVKTEATTATKLDWRERDSVWRSHTGYLFKWAEWGTWLMLPVGADEWVDTRVRSCTAHASTPFLRVGAT
jgi:hypothetical protein